DWRTNPETQIRWGLGYIKNRYRTPARALAAWLGRSPHWYDNGGLLPTGLSLVANNTGRPEPVLTSRQWDPLTHLATPASAAADADGREVGMTVNIYPRHAQLDEQELTRMLRLERLRHRVGRPV